MRKKFPDLTGDGEVTKADILKGRGVFKKGGSSKFIKKAIKIDKFNEVGLNKYICFAVMI